MRLAYRLVFYEEKASGERWDAEIWIRNFIKGLQKSSVDGANWKWKWIQKRRSPQLKT